jgi:hypothetical protein
MVDGVNEYLTKHILSTANNLGLLKIEPKQIKYVYMRNAHSIV